MIRLRIFGREIVIKSTADKVNEIFQSATVPDRKELEREAKEYEEILRKRKERKMMEDENARREK